MKIVTSRPSAPGWTPAGYLAGMYSLSIYFISVQDDNAEYGGNMDSLKTRVKVYHTGAMFWIAPLIVKGHCEIHVTDFPFDTQRCSLKFGSWTYDMDALDLRAGGIDTCEY